MKCELIQRYSDAYVDGEVSAETALEVERHLEDCKPCLDSVNLLVAMKGEVKRLVLETQAPESLRQRIEARLAETGPASDESLAGEMFPGRLSSPGGQAASSGPWIQFLPLKPRMAAGLGVLAAGALLTFYFGTSTPAGTHQGASLAGAVSRPVWEDLVQVHADGLPADVAGEEPQVTKFFRHRVRFPVRPARFHGQDARLVGGRLSNVRENRAAALYYEVDGRRVTVVMFDGEGKSVIEGAKRARMGGQDLYYRQVHGYPVSVRRQDGITYAILGEMDRKSLLELAASARVSY